MDEQWPINNPFGAVDDIYTKLGYKGHNGVDFACPIGTPVYASADGLVHFVGEAGTAGLMVVLDHNFGLTRYLHLSVAGVQEGDFVNRGDLIGKSGDSGRVTGSHLHWDFQPDGEPEDNGYGGKVDGLPFMVER